MNNTTLNTLKNIDYGFYCLTQYDRCGMFDDDIIDALRENTASILDKALLSEILDNAPNVNDNYNDILYELLMAGKINDNNIELLAEIWQALADGDMEQVLRLINLDLYDLASDYYIGTPDDLYNLADDDLRANGADANALYWVNDIHYGSAYNALDCCNVIHAYDSLDDLIDDLVDFCDIENAITQALGV